MKKSLIVLSSFGLKIFLSFWLIAIIAVLITRWVSIQWLDFEEVKPLYRGQLQHLEKTANLVRQLAKLHPDSISVMIENDDPRVPKGIWLKLDNTLVTSNRQPKDTEINQYLHSQKYPQPVAKTFRHYRIVGPVDIHLDNQAGQLFYGRPLKGRDIAHAIRNIPLSIRVTGALIITALLSYVVAWVLMRPINKLISASDQFGQGDLATRVEGFAHRHDEMGLLGKSFNTMAERIQTSVSAQQRLLGDISHELRSPLTRLQLALTLASNSNSNNKQDATQDKYLQRCQQELTKLEQMISQALLLSRLENQIQAVNKQPLALDTLIQTLLDDYHLLLEEKQLHINAQIDNDMMFIGDQQMLSSAIDNIFQNALRYSPAKSTITIIAKRFIDRLEITIQDQGPGVSPNQLTDIFKPFYRTSEARDRSSGGTGLGLAIAYKAITEHGGDIKAQLASNEPTMPGLQVTITVPVNKSAAQNEQPA
ncbi:ATP-binding protein [Thalassotalea maritima]|uniref:ATP-binding protein n=1 Tax=Thalassotalea maritima TaxID=3242416 RepID=UPI00352852DD